MNIVQVLLIIVLVLLILAFLPAWPYSAGLGYGPSGLLVVLLIVLIVLLVFPRK